MKRLLKTLAFVACVCAVLTGCSGMRIVDSDVTAFAAWTSAPPGPNTPYRFERLPSQQLARLQQGEVEAIASRSLAKVGMVVAPGAARFSVQVVLNTQLLERFADDGFMLGGPRRFSRSRQHGRLDWNVISNSFWPALSQARPDGVDA